MSKLNKKDIEELREFLSIGCDYSGTSEVVEEITIESLKDLGSKNPYPDEIGLIDAEKEFSTLDVFVEKLWGKAVEKIINVIATQ